MCMYVLALHYYFVVVVVFVVVFQFCNFCYVVTVNIILFPVINFPGLLQMASGTASMTKVYQG